MYKTLRQEVPLASIIPEVLKRSKENACETGSCSVFRAESERTLCRARKKRNERRSSVFELQPKLWGLLRLALGVLEAFARAGLTILLALDFAGVTGQKPGFLERGAMLLIGLA